MQFKTGEIEGVVIKKLVKNVDERGFLIETFRLDTLPEGLAPRMSYTSYTEPGVGRGPHEHESQTDLFAFIGPGNFKVYLWDNRKKSSTFGNKKIVFAGDDNPLFVIVPAGVVHGYKNISKAVRGMVLNYPDALYRGQGKKQPVDEIRHEDRGDEFFEDFVR
jgi:dTDP-4-dehydrorhamnose 3,5-epimerase